MRKPEQKLWDRMRRALIGRVRLERIENIVTSGMPDVLSTCDHVAFVELKAVVSPPVRDTTRLLGEKGLSIEQRNWHLDFARWGGCSYVLIGIGVSHLFMISGRHADLINYMTIDELKKHSVASNWNDVCVVLGGEPK